eukprot:1642719-Rhodomonas_salina.1
MPGTETRRCSTATTSLTTGPSIERVVPWDIAGSVRLLAIEESERTEAGSRGMAGSRAVLP